MWDKKLIYPKIEKGYAFASETNDELIEKFNIQFFTQGSAILKIKNYNLKNLIVQQIPVKEKEKKIEINCVRNGYIKEVLTSIDIQEIVEIGVKVVQIYEGVIYREHFKISPSEKIIDKLVALRKNIKTKETMVCNC